MLRQRGVDDVSQLSGGIHRYIERFPSNEGGLFHGRNFVFDQRVSVPSSTAVLSSTTASANTSAWEQWRKCNNLNLVYPERIICTLYIHRPQAYTRHTRIIHTSYAYAHLQPPCSPLTAHLQPTYSPHKLGARQCVENVPCVVGSGVQGHYTIARPMPPLASSNFIVGYTYDYT